MLAIGAKQGDADLNLVPPPGLRGLFLLNHRLEQST